MHNQISKALLVFFSLFLALSFPAEAGYKSGYKSSFRPSYKPPSSFHSGVSSTTSIKPSQSTSSRSATTGTKAAIAGNGGSITSDSASSSEKSLGKAVAGGSAKATNSVSGSKLVDKRGKIAVSEKTAAKPVKNEDLSPPNTKPSLSTNAPSSGLSKTIRDRKSSGGFNWTHLAMLYWLTSSSNSQASSMSAADKDWVQQQIREEESNGGSRDKAIRELNASGIDTSAMQTALKTNGSVAFKYDMPKAFTSGRVWMFVVSATYNGEQFAPTCQLEGATFVKEKKGLLVKWKAPATADQKAVMSCTAFGVEETYTLISS